MKRILGLDLGTNSIGWALVNEAENCNETSSIIKLGVRAIHFDTFVSSETGKEVKGDPSDFFKSGKGVSPNASRTQKRGARRNLQRYKLRRKNLIELLINSGIITNETLLCEEGNHSTFETYRLRAKAAEEEISLDQFARVLLMINKKRGYKSSRKAKGNEDGSLIDGMEIARRLYDEDKTPGQLCYELMEEGKRFFPDFYASDLQNELDKIWIKQSIHYPNILTTVVKDEIKGKNAQQTWAILSKYFIWTESNLIWDEFEGKTKVIEEEHRLVGIKRTLKGDALKKENFAWRSKALQVKMSLEELAVVFQEINKQINSSSGYLGSISDKSKVLYFNKQTVGQYLISLLDKNPNCSLKNMVFYRQDYLNEFETIWNKQASFHKELTNELKKQIRDVIIFYQRRLKSQKDLVSFCEFECSEKVITLKDGQKKILTGSKVIPRSSPLFQEFKIWQQLNNVEVYIKGFSKKSKHNADATGLFTEDVFTHSEGRRFLYQEEKDVLAKELSIKNKLSKSEVLSILFSSTTNYDINFKQLDGNTTNHKLFEIYSNIMERSGHESIDFKKPSQQIIEQTESIFSTLGWETNFLLFDSSKRGKDLYNQPHYKLWHLLYSFEGDNTELGNGKLIDKITKWTGMDKEYATLLANISFIEDYGNLSAKAISKILPYLKEGHRYDVACTYAGYRHSKSSLTKEENESRELKSRLEILPKNCLRNPVVEKILNQMINVINSIIDTYGELDEIRVELARELKKNADERKKMTKSIEETTKLHDEYKKILKSSEFGLSHVSRNDIIRYKLYEELKDNSYHTLYSNTYIPKEKLFSGEFDIEHIIPKARLFDDSISNKTIELRSINIEKSSKTAYDFVLEKYGKEAAEEYTNKCNSLFKDKAVKLNKLLMQESEIPKGFIERDLRNTQYIARLSLQILSQICRRVVATTGSITEKLRKDWQLVDMMKELNWEKYKSLGLVEYHMDRNGRQIGHIKDWTKRNDHRHHAMDALTVAFTKDVYIQYFSNVNASKQANSNEYAIKNKYFDNGRAIPPIPLDRFRAEAKQKMEELLISIKPKGKVVTKNTTQNGRKGSSKIQITPRGQLHDETIYGINKHYTTKEEKINASFNKDKISLVAKKAYRNALLIRLKEFNGDAKKAFTGSNSLDKKPIWLDKMHLYKVPDKVKLVYFEDKYTVRKPIEPKLNIEKVVDTKIRRMLQELVKKEGANALANLDEKPIWLNKEKGISVKRVTVTGISNAEAIHEKRDKQGNLIMNSDNQPIPVDFVNTGNNHHVAVYQKPILDKSGNYKIGKDGNQLYEIDEVVVSFYEAVSRANMGLPVIDKQYKSGEGWKFLYSMRQNEYFVFPNEKTGFNPIEIELTNPENYSLISPNLFRVQKFSHKNYVFRHHLETTVDNTSTTMKGITWTDFRSSKGLDKIVKVRINNIGQIISIGD